MSKKILCLKVIILSFVLSVMCIVPVFAATSTVKVGSATGNVGDEVKVKVSIDTGGETIGESQIKFLYNADILEFVKADSQFINGDNGMVLIADNQASYTLTFRIKAAGVANFTNDPTYESSVVLLSGDETAVSFVGGSVTGTTKTPQSTNNNLASLKFKAVTSSGETIDVNLTPAFSADVTTYNATLPTGVTKLVATATTADTNATIKITGLPMDPGKNTTTVTVTAQNGDVKKYVLYTFVGEAETEAPTEAPTPVIPSEEGLIPVTVDGVNMFMVPSLEGVTLPENYEIVAYTYKSNEVSLAQGVVQPLKLAYLLDENKENGSLYIYDEGMDIFYGIQTVQIDSKVITLLRKPNSVAIPSGYTEGTVTIGEQAVNGWLMDANNEIALLYGMNQNGAINLYLYDQAEGTVIRFVENPAITDQFNATTNSLKEQISSINAENEKQIKELKYIGVGLIAVIILLIVVIVILITQLMKRNNQYGNHNMEELEDTSEEDITEDAVTKENDTEDNLEEEEEMQSQAKQELEEYRVEDIELIDEDSDFEFLELEENDDEDK